MCPVTDGRTARVDAHGEFEPDRVQSHGCELDGQRVSEASLKPAVLRGRATDGGGDVAAGQIPVQTCRAEFAANEIGSRTATRRGLSFCALPSRHPPMMARGT